MSSSRGFAIASSMASRVISWNTIRLTGRLRLEHLDQVPRDGLALAVLVGREEELVGALERPPQGGDDFLGLALGRGAYSSRKWSSTSTPRPLRGQVADVTEAGQHREVVAEEAADGVGLGLRLDDHEGFGHGGAPISGSVPGRP